jgi:hypothetical protein
LGTLTLEAKPIEPAEKAEASKASKQKTTSKLKQWKEAIGSFNLQEDTDFLIVAGIAVILAFFTFIVAFSIGIYQFWFLSWIIFLALDALMALITYILTYFFTGGGGLPDLGRGVIVMLSFLTLYAINFLGGISLLIIGLLIGQWLIWGGAILMLILGLLMLILIYKI